MHSRRNNKSTAIVKFDPTQQPTAFSSAQLKQLKAGRSIPADIDHQALFNAALKFNHVYALDPKVPNTLPHGVDFFVVNNSLVKSGKFVCDKLVLVLQLTDSHSMTCISAKLSEDGKMIIVKYPSKDR